MSGLRGRPLPRLVLLPGLDGSGIAYRELRDRLADFDCRVVEYPRESHGYAELREHVREGLSTDGPFMLVGESYAGPLVVSIAASRPPNLVGIVLSASFLRSPRPWLGRLRALLPLLPARRLPARVLAPLLLGRHSTRQHRALIDETLAAASPRAMQRRLLDVAGVDVTALARRIAVPALYLRGTLDRLVPRTAGELVRDTIPGAELVDLVAPHLLLQVEATLASQHIRRFAASSDR